MLSFTSAWEDTSCMTALQVVAGSVTKQSRDKPVSPAPLPPCIHPIYKSTHQLALNMVSAYWPFPSFKQGKGMEMKISPDAAR